MMAAVRFEKWQALGNDYLIVEAEQLPFELTPERVRRLCDPHFGPGGDGLLELSPPTQAGFVARLRIFNPDGSEAELSGNGAREAILYLRRRGWTDADTFSIETVAGEIRPAITGETTCRVDMGRAKLRSKDFPDGPDDGSGEVEAGGRRWRFQHVSIGNPQCAIRVGSVEELEALDLDELGPPIQGDPQFPNRTNTSFWTELSESTIRARIFERGVGETLSSGTGASGAAVAHVLRGGDSPVTVRLDGGELEVDVDESLHIDLTGWAVPVYRGELSPQLVAELGSMA
jgi:diaminopimelate epimerase